MATRGFACEKIHMVPPDDNTEYWRLIVFEVDENGSDVVIDITHHDTEEWADRWLEEHWGVRSPPLKGERLRFEYDD